MQALRPFQRYADFRGRSGRAEYWQFILLNAVLSWLARVVDSLTDDMPGAMGGVLTWMFLAATIVPQTAVGVRRLHDRGKSGKIYIALVALTVVAGLAMLFGRQVQLETGSNSVSLFGLGLLMLVGLLGAYVLVQFCMAGDEGSNIYGPPDVVPTDTRAGPLSRDRSPSSGTTSQPLPASFDDNLASIERLGKLREQGLITEEEFAAQKRRLLASD